MSRDKILLQITINNVIYSINNGINTFKMTDDLLRLGRIASINITPPDTSQLVGFRWEAGDDIQVFFTQGNNQDLIFTGYIAEYQDEYNADGQRSITLQLIDKVGYIQTANPIIYGKKYTQRNILALFEKVLSDNGYDVTVNQDFITGNIRNSLSSLTSANLILKDDAVIQDGDTIGDFFDRYANKAQVLFTSDEEGNLLLTKENTASTDYGLVFNKKSTETNNVISRTYTSTIENRYSKVIVLGKQRIGINNTQASSNIKEEATDNTAPVDRTKIIQFQDPIESTTARQLARFIVNMNKSKAFSCSCIVVGFRWENGDLITSNKRVNISDITLQGEFHIRSVTYEYSNERMTTELNIVNKDVLTPDVSTVEQFGNFIENVRTLF